MTCQLHFRKGAVPLPLDHYRPTFQSRPSTTLSLFVEVKKFLEVGNCWLHLKVHLTENLKVAQVEYGVWSKILQPHIIVMEKFGTRWSNPLSK